MSRRFGHGRRQHEHGECARGGPIVRHEVEKIWIKKELLWATSGSIGVTQIVDEVLEKNYDKIFKRNESAVYLRQRLCEHIRPVLEQEYKSVASVSGGQPNIPFTNFIFGVHLKSEYHLISIECDMQGEVVPSKHFATGSGCKTGQATSSPSSRPGLGSPHWRGSCVSNDE